MVVPHPPAPAPAGVEAAPAVPATPLATAAAGAEAAPPVALRKSKRNRKRTLTE